MNSTPPPASATRRRLTHAIAIVAAMTLGMSACQSSEEDTMEYEQRVEQVAAAARADIDALAAQVGTNPDIVQDEIGDCTPGDSNSGISLGYIVHVTVEDTEAALARLRGPVSDQLAAKGWTVKPSPTGNPSTGEGVRFQKGATTMGASIFMDDTYAAVGGSGGCLEP